MEMDRGASWDKYTVYFNSGTRVRSRVAGLLRDNHEEQGTVPASTHSAALRSYVAPYGSSQIVLYRATADGYRLWICRTRHSSNSTRTVISSGLRNDS